MALMCCCFCSGLVIAMGISLLFILLLRFTACVLLSFIVLGLLVSIGYGENT